MLMTEEILVNHSAHETRIAVVQQGVVQELHLERAATRGLVGNVYLGRVSRVLPGMQSAFIDIGLDRAAFLHVADLWQSRANAHSSGHPMPIEKLLFDGKSMDAWRNYKQEGISDGWKIKDGAIVRDGNKPGDLITKKKFKFFEWC